MAKKQDLNFPAGMTGGDAIRFLSGLNEAAWSANQSLKMILESGALLGNKEARDYAIKVLNDASAKLNAFYSTRD